MRLRLRVETLHAQWSVFVDPCGPFEPLAKRVTDKVRRDDVRPILPAHLANDPPNELDPLVVVEDSRLGHAVVFRDRESALRNRTATVSRSTGCDVS